MPGTKKITTTKKYYKRKPSKPRMTLEKKIKQISLKEQETKLKVFSLFNLQQPPNSGLYQATGNNARGLFKINILNSNCLAMGQGTNQQERIGNSIHSCKLNIKGFVSSNPFTALTNTSPYPFEVHLLFYKKKDDPNNNPNEILNYPNNTNSWITGDAASTLYPWNRKGYIIKKHRIFKLKANVIAATSSSSDVVGLENPDFNGASPEFFKRFSINVPIKDTLQFDDGASGASNEWLSMAVYVVNGDGVEMTTTNFPQVRCKVTAFATLTYKDN